MGRRRQGEFFAEEERIQEIIKDSKDWPAKRRASHSEVWLQHFFNLCNITGGDDAKDRNDLWGKENIG